MIPICIPSKGRPHNLTSQLLSREGIPHILFIEPQDVAAYKAAIDPAVTQVFVLKDNDRGIGYARSIMLKYARVQRFGWFWMLDDDISGFYTSEEVEPDIWRARVCTARTAMFMAEMQRTRFGPTHALASLELRQQMWHYGAIDRTPAGCCNMCFMIHSERTLPLLYDEALPPLEDLDFTLACWAQGLRHVKFTHLGYTTEAIGSQQGGNFAIWRDSERLARCHTTLVERYPDMCSRYYTPTGDSRLRVAWRNFTGSTTPVDEAS